MNEPVIHTATVIEAFSQLAPAYEDTMQQELKQFWGINYLDFIHELVSIADIQAGERVLDIATGTARIPRQVIERLLSWPGDRFRYHICDAGRGEGSHRRACKVPGHPPGVRLGA
jgi:hypothetical protein